MATIQNNQVHHNVIDCGSSAHIIRFTADAKGGPERLWWDFDIIPDSQDDSELILELHHCQSILGGGNIDGSIYPVWQADNGAWQRLTNITRTALDDGRFIFSWAVPRPKTIGRFAACFPYQRKDLDNLIEKTGLRCDDIGVSGNGRFLPRVVNRVDETDSQIPGVFITARQHASEVSGSFVLEGILEAFAEQQDGDPMLWAMPFIDLDGVEEGRYGKNHFPLDHNRSWYGCGLCHTTRIAMQEAHRWAARCRPMLYLDLHGPGYMEEDCYFFSGTEGPDAEMKRFLDLAEQDIGNKCSDPFIRQSNYQVHHNNAVGIPNSLSANLWFRDTFNIASTTLECTYQAFKGVPASEEDYRDLGRQLAKSIRSYCGVLQNV